MAIWDFRVTWDSHMGHSQVFSIGYSLCLNTGWYKYINLPKQPIILGSSTGFIMFFFIRSNLFFYSFYPLFQISLPRSNQCQFNPLPVGKSHRYLKIIVLSFVLFKCPLLLWNIFRYFKYFAYHSTPTLITWSAKLNMLFSI